MGSSKNNRNQFLVQGSILAIASIIVRMIGLLYRIPMINTIGEEGNGYYSIAFNVYNIALILSSYSMPLAVSKLVAARNVKKEYRNSHKIFVGAMTLGACSGLIAALLIYFGADFIASVIYKDIRVAYPLKVLAPTLFVFSVMGVLRGFFQGKNTMLPTAFSQVLEQIINAVVSIMAAQAFMYAHDANKNIAAYGAAGGTLGTFVGASSALLFLGFIYIIYRPTIMRQVRRDRYSKKESFPDIYKLLLLTIIPVILSQTVYQISGMLDDVIFTQIMDGKGMIKETRIAFVGIYNKYKILSNVPIAISSAVAASMIPSIVASREIGAHTEVKEKIRSAIKFNMVVAFPAGIGMTVLANPIMNLIFPNSDASASTALMIGGIAVIFYSLSTVSNAILQGVNKMRLPVIHAVIALVVHIILLIVLLNTFDKEISVYALVIANVTFPILICILNWIAIARKLTYKQELIKTFLIPFISSLLMGVFAFFTYKGIYHLVIKSNAIATLTALVVAVISYFVIIILFRGLSRDELYNIPKGKTIVRIATKLHLL